MRYLIIASLFIVFGCDFVESNKAIKEDKNIKKSFYPNGKVKSELFYNDSSKIILAKNYYKTGEMATEIPYKNEMRNGISKKYYENGKIYRETPYENNIIHGVQKKYYESGQLMAEIPYNRNMPGKSIKEYTEKGKLITKYPEIIAEHNNTIQQNGIYTVKIYLSDNSPKVSFYKTRLIDDEFLNTKLTPIPGRDGKAEIIYRVKPGQYISDEHNIVAYKTTSLRSPLILTKKIIVNAE